MKQIFLLSILTLTGCVVESSRWNATKSPRHRALERTRRPPRTRPRQPVDRRRIDDADDVPVIRTRWYNDEEEEHWSRRRYTRPWFISKTNRTTTATTTTAATTTTNGKKSLRLGGEVITYFTGPPATTANRRRATHDVHPEAWTKKPTYRKQEDEPGSGSVNTAAVAPTSMLLVVLLTRLFQRITD